MHPDVTIKSWEHNVRMMQLHELAESARKLVRDPVFWVIVAYVALLITVLMIAINAQNDASMNYVPMYPLPMIVH